MCGIFGIIANNCSTISRDSFLNCFTTMMKLSESRGKDSSGVITITDELVNVLKRPLPIKKLSLTKSFYNIKDNFLLSSKNKSLALLGHTRMATNGNCFTHFNNQPILRDDLLLIHNGIITNENSLQVQYDIKDRKTETDSEIFLCLINYFEKNGFNYKFACIKALELIQGANSVGCFSAKHKQFFLSSSNGSLYYYISTNGNELFFSSEKYILSQALKYILETPLSKQIDETRILQLTDKSYILIDLYKNFLEELIAKDSNLTSSFINDIQPDEDESNLYLNPNYLIINRNKYSDSKLLKIDQAAIYQLKRCTRCILPETFPFIYFDLSGECNYCKKLKSPEILGKDRLVAMLKEKSPDFSDIKCLFPISGGRDSCYGLHVLCNEIGIRPIAYTYDWGMVTDLARRNISRLCGHLKVEHIVVSADIKRKRYNIRLNVLAWLKRPKLGMIPLFMAGDKQFFYFANKLKKQMGLDSIIFSMNPLERTDFKVGFCNINEDYNKEQHYNLSTLNKIKMFAYYVKEFATNMDYINQSLFDSFFAYISYYLIKRDYVSIFDYIEWKEKIVEETLIKQYDWEVSNDTKSTWRIGDGTASFYNYIYYRVAGFSENDTLRSNMVRSGQITRDEALEKSYTDNLPRFDSIKWYCDTIGIDFNDTIRLINMIPTLY
jgi:glucosamine--fructose-6-phosphate aminotransferase (isomerizing)